MDELVFVFLGTRLPYYAKASLQLAHKYSGLRVCLIGNKSLVRDIPPLDMDFVAVEDFYEPSKFLRASKRVWSDHNFRGGLWLKSLERLFVIQQYMEKFNKTYLMHAELDQLVFGLNIFMHRLKSLPYSGLFSPLHNPQSAVASILFVNDLPTLNSLLDYSEEAFFPNEMNLIANWAHRNPGNFFELPTAASFFKNRTKSLIDNVRLLSVKETAGLVDAAQLGQWVAGIDPKNISLATRPLNKFVDKEDECLLNQSQLLSLKFRINEGLLKISGDTSHGSQVLFNLHLHSKIHQEIISEKITVQELIAVANSDYAVELPGTRRQQFSYWSRITIRKILDHPGAVFSALIGKVNTKLGLRLSSKPFISGDSFRAEADFIWERDSKFTFQELEVGDSVFCESNQLDDLNSSVLSKIDFPIVLILGNSDRDIYFEDIDELKLVPGSTVFSQNLRERIRGVTPIPIGLENRWRANNGRILPFLYLPLIKRRRANNILWGFSVGTNPIERSKASFALMKASMAIYAGKVRPGKHRRLLTKYKFVVSPPGNGIDTHRTWEAMYLGCVPILLDSYLARFYESMGLPVWVVESYDNLILETENSLHKKYEKIISNSKNEDLWFSNWKKRIIEAKRKARITHPGS